MTQARDIRVVLKEQVLSQDATRHGLVVGIEKYLNPKLNLKYVRRDAQAMRDVMVSPECGLFEEKNVQLLLDEDATFAGLRLAFSRLGDEANEEDTVWIFYAGHGAVEGNETYWVTHDADTHNLRGTAMPSREIKHYLEGIAAKRLVTFLDCCHAEATVQTGTRQVLTAEEAFAAFQGEGRFAVCSCEGKQKSVELDEHEHGAFTHFLVEGLRGAADVEGHGVVIADDLWKYLEDRVTKAARQAPTPNPQTPRLISNVSHRLALTLNTKDLARKAELEKKLRALYGRLTGAECDLAIRLLHEKPASDAEARLAEHIETLANGADAAVRMFKTMVAMMGPSEPRKPEPLPAVKTEPEPPKPEPRPEPTAAPGLIFVQYEPDDAELTLDGRKIELDDMDMIDDVPAGEYVLRVAAPFCEPAEVAVTVEPGRVARLDPIQLKPGQGALTVVTSPPGARIIVDGEDTGQRTPDTLDVTAGEHEVRLELEGRRPATASVAVDVGQTELVRETLQALPTVHFQSDPPGAEVSIAGQRRGQTPFDRPLEPGSYEVTFELDGHESKTGQLRVQEGQDARCRITLEPEARIVLPSGLSAVSQSKDRYGNAVRRAEDAETGLPLEAGLDTIDMPMILCPGGPFMMGEDDEIHEVDVPAFYMAKYQVTNRQWKQFVDASSAWRKDQIKSDYHDGDYLKHWDGDSYPSDEADHPVVYVSWFAAKAFSEWAGGRLPTEAEWEKACRAGTTTKYCFGDDGELGEYAWYDDNSGSSTHPAGEKKPNDWGLYDLHGNVWEWCSSKKESYPYNSDDGREDTTEEGVSRVLRGGSWDYGAAYSRSAYRLGYVPARTFDLYGFRVVFCVRAFAR